MAGIIIDASGTDTDISAESGSITIDGSAPGGGAWNLIGTAVASASASLTITGLDSTYDTYAIAISDFVPASAGQDLMIRVGDSGGVDSGAADYSYANICARGGYASAVLYQNDSTTGIVVANDTNTTSGAGAGGMLYLNRPGDGSTYPNISGTMWWENDSTHRYTANVSGCMLSTITLDRIQLIQSSGNITSGRMTVWGISHA